MLKPLNIKTAVFYLVEQDLLEVYRVSGSYIDFKNAARARKSSVAYIVASASSFELADLKEIDYRYIWIYSAENHRFLNLGEVIDTLTEFVDALRVFLGSAFMQDFLDSLSTITTALDALAKTAKESE